MIWSNVLRDLRFGWRQLAAHPIATTAAVLTIAIGIGINTANFSVVHAFLLSPLKYEEPSELVHLFRVDKNRESENRLGFSWPFLDDMSETGMFSEVGAYSYRNRVLGTGDKDRQQVAECQVTPSLFSILGVQPRMGRSFSGDETIDVNNRMALIAHQLWIQRFGGRADILGETFRMDGEEYLIIGVMGPDFNFPFGGVKVWTPAVDDSGGARRNRNLSVVARLQDGVTLSQASQVASSTFQRKEVEFHGEGSPYDLRITSLKEALLFLAKEISLLLLLATVANFLVLFTVCSNISILLVVRLAERRRELAIRQSLGAARSRLVWQLLAEAFLLASLGSILGLVVAYLNLKLTASTLPDVLFRAGDLALNTPSLFFALMVTFLTTALFALLPVLRTTKNLVSDINASVGGTGLKTQKLRRGAITNQVLALTVLVMSTTTVSRSFREMQAVNFGFDSDRLLTMEVQLPQGRYKTGGEVSRVYDAAKENIAALPGVVSVAYMTPLPLNFETSTRRYRKAGDDVGEAAWRTAREHRTSADYFSTMDIPLVRGRGFESTDNAEGNRVAILNLTMARRLFSIDEAIGQQLTIIYGGEEQKVDIVGVVQDTKSFMLNEGPQSLIYLPQSQFPSRRNFFLLRTEVPPMDLVGPARQEIEQLEAMAGLSSIRTMDTVVEGSLVPWEMTSKAMALIALLTIALAAIGIYGLTAHTTTTRSRELGLRMALGAPRQEVLLMLLKQNLRAVVIGIVLGLVVYSLLIQLAGGLIYGVSALDLSNIALALGVVFMTTFLASLVPARKALGLDLSKVLRYE